jgi:hypothetical protein
LLIGGTAERHGQRCGFMQRVAFDDFVTGDDDRTLGLEDPRYQYLQGLVGGFYAGIDPGRTAQFNTGFRIEDIAGQRDEHRPGRRRGRDLGGAADDPRQVLEPRHLDRPFHQRFGHPDQRPIQQRLRQAMALLLLAGGQDHRRAGKTGVVKRSHRIAETGRDMDIAGDEAARRAAETVGDRDHQALLHRHHISEVGMVFQGMHDRQFGGAGIAEQMRDALVL